MAIEGARSPYRVTMRARVAAGREAGAHRRGRRDEDGAEGAGGRAGRLLRPHRQRRGAVGAGDRELYGRELPVTPLPRQVFLLRHPDVNLEPDAVFHRLPAGHLLPPLRARPPAVHAGELERSRTAAGHDFAHDGQAYYDQHVRPRLVKRIAQLNDATLIGGWTGHYELSPDKAAIVGDVPDRPGIFNYNGLSAHGVMQSRGIGEALADYLTAERGRRT